MTQREPGYLVGRRYQLTDLISTGGMGEVFKAVDTQLFNRTVAVKLLHQELGKDPAIAQQMRQRFEEEARVSTLLGEQSSMIITILDYGVDGSNPYLVMEHLVGVGLEMVIKQSAPLPPDQAAYLGRQICAGLHHAHRFEAEIEGHLIKGVVHRDIKPSNIFVISDPTLGDSIKILDFGIAKMLSDASVVLGSQTTGFLGTVRYSSPEQMRGDLLDARSDIYSLGIVLYQMLTRSLPLSPPTGTFAGWYQGHNHARPKPFPRDVIPHNVPQALEDVVMACLAKDPDDRPQTVQQLSDALGTAVNAEGSVLFNQPAQGQPFNRPDLNQPGFKRSEPPTSRSTPSQVSNQDATQVTREADDAAPSWLPIAFIGGGVALFLAGVGIASFLVLRSSNPVVTPTDADVFLSQGERILLPNPEAPTKAAGAGQLADGNLEAASVLFREAVIADRNDPESLIYLNNIEAVQMGDPFTFATVVPISSNPARAEETLRGVAQAQQIFQQQGGLNGQGLRILIADDGDDAEQARTMAQRLVGDTDVLGVIGHNSSGASIAGAEVYQLAGVPMVSSTSTSTQISTLGDAIFRTVPSDQIAGTQLARHALEALNTTSAAIFFNPASSYSQSLKTAFETTMATENGRIVGEFDLAAADFDPASAVQLVETLGGQVIFLAPNNATAPQAIAVGEANQASASLPLLGGDVLFSFTVLENGSVLDNMVVAVPWHPDTAPNPDFSQAAVAQWGGQVSWRTALAYDATSVLLEALTQTEDPTREGLKAALNTPGFTYEEGASGQIQFQPSGDRLGSNELVQVQAQPGSSPGYAFVPLLEEPDG